MRSPSSPGASPHPHHPHHSHHHYSHHHSRRRHHHADRAIAREPRLAPRQPPTRPSSAALPSAPRPRAASSSPHGAPKHRRARHRSTPRCTPPHLSRRTLRSHRSTHIFNPAHRKIDLAFALIHQDGTATVEKGSMPCRSRAGESIEYDAARRAEASHQELCQLQRKGSFVFVRQRVTHAATTDGTTIDNTSGVCHRGIAVVIFSAVVGVPPRNSLTSLPIDIPAPSVCSPPIFRSVTQHPTDAVLRGLTHRRRLRPRQPTRRFRRTDHPLVIPAEPVSTTGPRHRVASIHKFGAQRVSRRVQSHLKHRWNRRCVVKIRSHHHPGDNAAAHPQLFDKARHGPPQPFVPTMLEAHPVGPFVLIRGRT